MQRATAYDCPNCGAALHFDPGAGDVLCDYCGGSFSVAEVAAAAEAKKAAREAADAAGAAGAKAQKAAAVPHVDKSNITGHDVLVDGTPAEGFQKGEGDARLDWGNYAENLRMVEFDESVVYNCRNCGAQVVTDGVTAATVCPYCDSSLVVDDRVSGGFKPECVIPFAITKQQLPALLQNFYKDRPLLPNGFFAENKVEKAQGVYVPFWLFSGTMDGRVTYNATRTHAFVQGDYDVVETSHYLLTREGSVHFADIPVDGSERMDDDVMDSIEPFDYEGLEPFNAAYLTGYVADRFDQGPEFVLDRASIRMLNSASEVFRSTTTEFLGATEAQSDFEMIEGSVRYVMLPVYLFNAEYRGQKYRYAINGQTGKVVGEVPTDPGKRRKAFWIPAAAAAAVAYVAMMAVMLFMM